jgi:hypothetical protein
MICGPVMGGATAGATGAGDADADVAGVADGAWGTGVVAWGVEAAWAAAGLPAG